MKTVLLDIPIEPGVVEFVGLARIDETGTKFEVIVTDRGWPGYKITFPNGVVKYSYLTYCGGETSKNGQDSIPPTIWFYQGPNGVPWCDESECWIDITEQ